MPTMRQTGINPQTHQKLCGTKRSSSSSSSFIPIRTPSALLARDPHQLSSSLQVSLPSIQHLRSAVAECVVLDPFVGHGGRAAEIREGVSTYCTIIGQKQQQQQPQQLLWNDSNRVEIGTEEEGQQQKRPAPITLGAVTALDLYAQTLLTKRIYASYSNNNSNGNEQLIGPFLEYISTGSRALDTLLRPETAYTSFEEGCDLSSSSCSNFHIPNFDFHNSNNNARLLPTHNNHHPFSSSRGGGIPFGQITELSGKTSSGKTQLALTITAHALLDNNLQVKYLIGGGNNSRKAISRRLFAICSGVARSRLLEMRRLQPQQQQQQQQVNIDKEAKSLALKCLERVTIATVPDAYSLLGSLVQIENEELSRHRTTTSANNNNSHPSQEEEEASSLGTLLVIDSISGCLGHHIYSDRTLGASLSNQVSMTLRQITRSLDGHLLDGSSSMRNTTATTATTTTTDVLLQNPPRRFAALVINGTVGKGTNDTSSGNEVTNGMKTSKYKPAMGRYWHGGDVGLWLEEQDNDEDVSGDGNGSSSNLSAVSFYDGNVAGLSRSNDKVVTARLQWHYGKSLGGGVADGKNAREEQCDGRQVRFVIQAGGVADV